MPKILVLLNGGEQVRLRNRTAATRYTSQPYHWKPLGWVSDTWLT